MSAHPATPPTTVAAYLAHRLRQLGVEHLVGVPGDYNLPLLEGALATGCQRWVGARNELNAGYAADGYARRRGLAALVTTYGVGELSGLNAVAGSYAENVPVVQVTGAPPTRAAAAGDLLHHTLADGDLEHFVRCYREVTAAAVVLDARDAAEQVDAALETAVRELRPVYLAVPVDVATAAVDGGRLATPLSTSAPVDPASCEAFAVAAAGLLDDAATGTVLAGHVVLRRRLQEGVQELAAAGGLAVVDLVASRGVVPSTNPWYAGTYCGALGDKEARRAVDDADVLVHVGTAMTDAVTGAFSHRDDPARTITLGVRDAVVAGRRFPDVPVEAALGALLGVVNRRPPRGRGRPERSAHLDAPAPHPGAVLDQRLLWEGVEAHLPAGTTVLAEMGTSFWGAAAIDLPDGASVLAQPVWGSIGYTLPATLGLALADPGSRPLLVIGDGAAQMTVQELSTIAAHGLTPVVLVVDNAGYTIERALQSPEAGYHDVPGWSWGELLRSIAPTAPVATAVARTVGELDRALREAWSHDVLTLVEARVGAHDLPAMLADFAAAV
ncbi:alpha-keto acid decarboxylase family protein [Thalassiella azotivora]